MVVKLEIHFARSTLLRLAVFSTLSLGNALNFLWTEGELSHQVETENTK
jgi:hypothetical protein